MTYSPRRHQIQKNATLTATGNSGLIPNLGRSDNPTIVLLVDVQGAVSGTSPSLTVSLYAQPIDSDHRPALVGSASAITGATSSPQRVVFQNVMEQELEVVWTITGTTPSFGGVYIDLIMSSPDA